MKMKSETREETEGKARNEQEKEVDLETPMQEEITVEAERQMEEMMRGNEGSVLLHTRCQQDVLFWGLLVFLVVFFVIFGTFVHVVLLSTNEAQVPSSPALPPAVITEPTMAASCFWRP